jgi:Skp family chaperone for outer membrane proteins
LICLALISFVAPAIDAQPVPPPPPAQTGPTHIAIANPSRIFNEMQETKTLREKLEVRRKDLLAKEEQMRAAIKAKMDELSQINPKASTNWIISTGNCRHGGSPPRRPSNASKRRW